MSLCVYVYVCLCVYVCVCVYDCVYVCMSVYVCVCLCVCMYVYVFVELQALNIQLQQTPNTAPSCCTQTKLWPPLIILTSQIRLHLNYSFKGLAAITRNRKQTDAHKLYFTTTKLIYYRFLVAMRKLQVLQKLEGDISNTTLTFQRPVATLNTTKIYHLG